MNTIGADCSGDTSGFWSFLLTWPVKKVLRQYGIARMPLIVSVSYLFQRGQGEHGSMGKIIIGSCQTLIKAGANYAQDGGGGGGDSPIEDATKGNKEAD
jgi:hypothetical protein